MSKQTKKDLVPRLRFPEFRDAGEWVQRPLGKLGQTISGLSGKSGEDFGSGKPFVTYKQVFDCAWIDFAKCGRVKIADKEKQNELKRGDVLFTTSSETPDEVGFASVLLDTPPEPVYLNSFCFSFRPDNLDILKPEFSRYFFHSPIYRKSISVLAQGSTRYNISKGAFLKLNLPIPYNGNEQQKIADCLSSVDELITTQARKVDALKAHKKGLMQQLFPAEGETVPKLRFPEFRDAGEWEMKTLGQVADYENGKAHEQDIDEQGKYIVVNSKFVSTAGEVKKFSHAANLLAKKDDILMVLSDVPNGRAIAKCFYVDKDNTYTVNQRICKLSAKNAVSVMLFYMFDRNSYFLAFDDGVKQTNLKKDDVLNCPILLPKDLKEQQKIADCFTLIDELIVEHAKKLDILKAHKKGLMQQLFPSPDEVNG